MRVRAAQVACGVLLAVGMPVVAVAPAFASREGKPFEIVKFAMQTTHTIETRRPFNGQIERVFENVPYAFTQAGGHPWALTTTVEFLSEKVELANGSHAIVPTRDPKDVIVDLPPGLLGDPMAVPRCPLAQALGGELCPAATQVGVARVRLLGGLKELLGPIVNVTPELGQSAEFVLETGGIPFVETGHLVRTAQGYGFAVVANDIPMAEVVEAEQTFWGVPADPSHDPMRGLRCGRPTPRFPLCEVEAPGTKGGGYEHAGVTPVPFLTWTTDCSAGPEHTTIRGDSWEQPGSVGANGRYEGYFEEAPPVVFPGATGCNILKFEPGIEVQPDTLLADEPVGLGVSLKIPLSESPAANATPQMRDSVVTLPEGMSVSPGVVDGVRACEAFGPEGINITAPPSGPDLSEEPGPNGELQLAPGHCPDASIVGTVEAITPFLPVPVKGHVYLAKPECGGPGESHCTEQDALDGKLYKLYLELGGTGELAQTGIEFKVEGDVQVDPATGQLTTRFEKLVQAPYSEVRIDLNGGPRASLANPAVCGPAVTTTDLTPWSAPGTHEGLLTAGTPDATPSSHPFYVEGCSDPPPLHPGFVAGTVTPQAGQFSSFTLNLSRSDREQYVKGIQLHTPPGLLGMLSSVPLCGEPEADSGTCPEASKIGTTRVATGAGSHPFEIEGNVYLTGPWGGDPFGLGVVVHVVAGPFNLGVKVVRARIAVDPQTSALTVTTDETGPYAVPQIVFGVPVRLKRVTVDIDRPSFMFNPTNCGAQQITASISGSQDAVATVSSPFAVGGCRSLEFKPKFTVSTNGHTSRAGGASLDARLSYPSGSMGNDANIAKVKVSLPKQLPSRLTTLQKACPAEVFDKNPASCPRASIVGIARAHTPLLPDLPPQPAAPGGPPSSVMGPVYFVSHGGQAFPNLIVVLQGDGVRVDLVGDTFINKAGITSSTFNTVPDVPVNSFELYLPQGEDSALAANGSLCKAKGGLRMPTEFVAQNGAIIKQNTRIAVSGCAKRPPKRARHRRQGHGAHASRTPRGNRGTSGRTGR